jgi:magnesium chelatase family protein
MFSLKKHSNCVYACPCGYFSDSERQCTCSHQTVTRYQKRISGPILDRIDIHIEVPRVDFEKLSDNRRGESSDEIRARVEQARQRQRASPKSVNFASWMKPVSI